MNHHSLNGFICFKIITVHTEITSIKQKACSLYPVNKGFIKFKINPGKIINASGNISKAITVLTLTFFTKTSAKKYAASHIKTIKKSTAIKTPAAVDNPLPPLNFSHMEKLCPATSSVNGIIISSLFNSLYIIRNKDGSNPFKRSTSRTITPSDFD